MKEPRLHRMVMPDHLCPSGLKALDLLKREGFEVDDRPLTSRPEVDAFKAEHGVATTPQIWIGDERIGGYSDLRKHLGKVKEGTTYWPVGILFAMTALMALGAGWVATGEAISILAAEWFVSFSMCALAYLKLRDIEAFSLSFVNYDLLARRWVPYSFIYPWAEGLAGVLMTAHILDFISIPVALFIGTIGAVSVFKAVYLDKRSLKCACVGGNSNVPLGFVSLTENLFMIGMAIWMLVKPSMG
ncbi:glutaredoxin family protein [Sphingomicrobium clamense]|uniref:Methylamine utilization protein MauE n=1 Tax=Sphingomicrobium clamense TaxID=2851013 RepID=A0ABS6V7S4_9SPHN|nr:glutaredoxin [Sphingomicrobium sp. B8]MBW0145609.1 glutaredoxin [Sphingomicrobium sp. B8]